MNMLMLMSIPVFILLLVACLTFENKDEEEIIDQSLVDPLIPKEDKSFNDNEAEEYHSSESLENL